MEVQTVQKNKLDVVSLSITSGVAVLLFLFLLLMGINYPLPQEEAGVAVMMGSMGNLLETYDYTEVAAPTQDAPQQYTAPVDETVADPIVAQDIEESLELKTGDETQQVETAQNLIDRRDSIARSAAAQAQMLMANLFGESQSTEPQESQQVTGADAVVGSALGNELYQGKLEGTGGFSPKVDLNGRSIGEGGLVRPVYSGSDEEGRVVVTIEVDPSGKVVRTSINSRSNTANAALCNAAEQAALATHFNAVPGPDKQMGTITYYFRHK